MKKEKSPYSDNEKKYLLMMKKRLNPVLYTIHSSLPPNLSKIAKEAHSYNIVMAQKGRRYNTEAFSDLIIALESNYKNIFFYIGDDQGNLPVNMPESYAKISLSDMIFNHFIARLMLLEQLYRVQCILTNHPYHQK